MYNLHSFVIDYMYLNNPTLVLVSPLQYIMWITVNFSCDIDKLNCVFLQVIAIFIE